MDGQDLSEVTVLRHSPDRSLSEQGRNDRRSPSGTPSEVEDGSCGNRQAWFAGDHEYGVQGSRSPCRRFPTNAPCLQSCWSMNRGTRRTEFPIPMGNASQTLIDSYHHARTQSATQGTQGPCQRKNTPGEDRFSTPGQNPRPFRRLQFSFFLSNDCDTPGPLNGAVFRMNHVTALPDGFDRWLIARFAS